MIIFLAKVFQLKEHADAFLGGEIYANRLSYFKRLEDSDVRGDRYEGAILPLLEGTVIDLKRTDPATGEVEGITMKADDLAAPVVIQPRWFDHINLFCMYAGYTGEFQHLSSQNLPAFIRQLEMTEESLELGQHAVVVTNTTEFFRRVEDSANRAGFEIRRGLVRYYDAELGRPDIRSNIGTIFAKRKEYQNQKEYRLAINTGYLGDLPIALNIGNIEDIAIYISAHEFNEQLHVSFRSDTQS